MRKRIIPNVKNLLKAIKVACRGNNTPYRNYMADHGKVTIEGANNRIMGDVNNILFAFLSNSTEIVKVIRGHITIFVVEGEFRERVDESTLRYGLPEGVEIHWEEEEY